jgi:hypothetical protein
MVENYSTLANACQVPDPGWNIVRRRPKVLAFNNTHVVNSTTVASLRAGWMSFPSFGTPGSADFDLANLGFPARYVSAITAEKFPRIGMVGKGQLGGAASGPILGDAGYAYTRDSSWSLNGSVTKLFGRQSLKWGADFRHLARRSKVVAEWGTRLDDRLPNPFFGIAEAGALSTAPTVSRAQLLRPFPHFGNVQQDQTTGARTRYHAVTTRLEKRQSQGGWWSGRFHYTWSRLDSDQFSEDNYYTTRRQTLPLNGYDLRAEYSRSLQDSPHRLVLSPIVQLPFGEGHRWATRGWADRVLGGWQFSMVATFESGYPVNVVQLTDNTGSFGGMQRPNWTNVDPAVAGDVIDILSTYINPAAYAAAPAFTFGSGPRTDSRVRTPVRTNYDVALSKETPVVGRIRAAIRLELLNATNSPKFVGPETRVGAGGFGALTQQAGLMRLTQLMVRFTW